MKLVYIGILLAALTHFFPARYTHIYYYSRDKSQCVTQVEYLPFDYVPNHTYFTSGHYDDHAIPDGYVHPLREGNTGWSACIHFENDQPYIFFRARKLSFRYGQDPLTAVNYPAGQPETPAGTDAIFIKAKTDNSGNTFFVTGK
jgi:hypothetical protein